MSRLGKLPIDIPNGVKVAVANSIVSVEGPKGKLDFGVRRGVAVDVEDKAIKLRALDDSKESKINWGTTRAYLNNMVQGVTKGWQRSLELSGVGFTAKLQGQTLVLATGFSHEKKVVIPPQVNCKVEKQEVYLESADKELIGRIASTIRDACPPEPYLGKGIKYREEHIRRKAGKTGK